MDSTLLHIGLILAVLYFMGSTASSDDVSSTNYVDFELKGMFRFSWKAKFSKTNCSLTYARERKLLRNGPVRTELSQFSQWEYEIENPNEIDLNGNLSVLVQAKCNNITIDSLNKTVELAPGDERTAVKNFKCVWYHLEYVKCTWEPGPKTPPNTKYRVLYWIKDKTKEERPYKETEFWDLLETGSTCEPVYPSKDTKTVECQLPSNESIKSDLIAMVVTDTSRQIKPYIYYNDTYQIAKLKPPEIFEAYRTPNNTIYVSWSTSHDFTDLDYELLLAPLSSGPKEHLKPSLSYISHPVLPDVTYTVKVRAKIKSFPSETGIWSDWSKEFIIKGKEGEKLTAIILPLIFSILLIIVAVTLLVHMEKLKAIICPQIPDPGRIFSKDLQQWLKTDMPTVYSKPEKEEICPVYLIESPPTVKCV